MRPGSLRTDAIVPSAEAQQVGRSGGPLSIWLQWNLCWAGTNKPNLVSNIISLGPNLIPAPVFKSSLTLSLSLSPQLLVSLPPSVLRSISLCECHLPPELATLGLGLGVRALFTLTGGFVFPVNQCVRECFGGCVCVCAGGECQRVGDLLHQRTFRS